MDRNKTSFLILFATIAMSFALSSQTASAQNAAATQKPVSSVRIDTRILYHNGRLRTGLQHVYLVWYGCWDNNSGFAGDTARLFILTDFIANLGSSPYFQINSTYSDSSGQVPSGALLYAGCAVDRYSHGMDLKEARQRMGQEPL